MGSPFNYGRLTATKEGLTSSHEQVHDKHDQQHAADPATDYGPAIIIPTASTEQKQQNDNDQDNVHVPSGMSLLLLRDVGVLPRAIFGSRATPIQKRSIVSTIASKASVLSGLFMYPLA
jgi:hypothetical protein